MTDLLELTLTARTDGLRERIEEAAGALDKLGMSGNGADRGLTQSLERLKTAVTSAQSELRMGGMRLGSALTEGMNGARASVEAAATALGTAAKIDASGPVAQARSAGAAVGQGFASGLSSKQGAVDKAVSRMVNNALAKLRSALDIHSPSRVTQKLGGYFAEGFALGVEKEEPELAARVGALAGGAARQLAPPQGAPASPAATTRQEAAPSIDLTVPLYIDGEKLGEACVRGINKATKRAGRVLLEM